MTGPLFIALVFIVHLIRSVAKPEPADRVFCHRCDARFRSQQGLSWHVQAAHPETFEGLGLVPTAQCMAWVNLTREVSDG